MADGRIEEGDLISKAALQAPGKLADQLEKIVTSLERILSSAKKSESAITGAKSTAKVTTEVQKLTKAQRDLAKEQEKAAKIAKTLWLSENEVAESFRRAGNEGKKTGTVISDLDKKQAAAANSATLLSNAQKSSASQSAQANQAYKAEVGTLESLTQRRIQLKNAIIALRKDQKEDNDLVRKGIISRQEFNKRMAESEAVIAKNQVSIRTLNGQIQNHILTNGRLAGEYKKLTLQLESARTKYKDMAASGMVANKVLDAQQKIVLDLDKKVKAIDASVGQFNRNVGNYPKTFNAAAAALSRFLGAFGILTGIALFAKAMKDVVELTTEFEYKNDTLMAVLGETEQGIKALTDQQLKYGKATIYSALQVADLQIIFSKMGLTTAEIRNATEATLNLATATGEDLAKSADVVGTLLKSFGLDATETTRVVDVMTGSFNKTTLGLDNFFEAMKYVAPIAKANNITLEETTAMLGTLADAGIRGSMAGTSLRKIISELDKGSGTLTEKIKALAATNYTSADAMDEVGRTAYASLLALTQNAEATEKLDQELHNVNGTAAETARIMGDNLRGDTLLLKNATESLALTYQKDFNEALRSIVQTMTRFVYALAEIPSFLKENKGLIAALAIAILALNAATIKSIVSTLAYEVAMKRLIIQEKIANFSTKALWATMAANPLGLILAAIAALVAAVSIYDKVSERAEKVTKQRNMLNQELAKQTDNVTAAQKSLNISVDTWLKMSEEQKRSAVEQIEFTIAHSKVMLERLKVQKLQLEADAKQLTLWQTLKAGAISFFSLSGGAAQGMADANDNATEATEGMDEAIKNLEVEIDNLTHLMDGNNAATDEAIKKAKQLTDEEKKRALEARRAQLELDKFRLERQVKVLGEIEDNENQSADRRIAASEQAEGKLWEIAAIERERALLDVVKGGKVVARNNAEIQLINEKYQAALTDIAKKGTQDRDKINAQFLEKSIVDAERTAKIITDRILSEQERRGNELVASIQKEVLAGRISREKGDEEIFKAQQANDRELIELSIQTYEQMLANERFIYYDERVKQIEKSNMLAIDKEAALLLVKAESAEEQAEIEKKLAELRAKLIQNLYESQTGLFDNEIRDLKKVQGYYEDFSKAITGLFNAITARRIANIDNEIAKSEEFFNKQIEQAGDNDKAKAQIEKQAEGRRKQLDRERVKEQRKAARLEKAQAVISATISGSLAVLNALSTVKPYPLAVVAAISAGVLAAAEVATIIAQPIPQYADGTPIGGHPGGLALVGDGGGRERIEHSGRTFYSPDRPTLVNMPAGAVVTPYEETMADLALGALMRGSRSDRQAPDSGVSREMISELQGIKKEIRNSKAPVVNYHQIGHMTYKSIEAKRGFVEYMRELSMGKRK